MTDSKVYRGPAVAMKPDSEFLGAMDIQHLGDVWLKIEAIYEHSQRKACGVMQKKMYTAKLVTADGKPCKKEWWLKSTNINKLSQMYGGTTDKWEGKWVCLYVTEVKSPTGGMTLGVRIRDSKGPPPASAKQEVTTNED